MRFALEKIRDFRELIRTLSVGLQRLDFDENFDGQINEDLTLTSGQELQIRNSLNFIPSKCIILFQRGNANVTAGDTENDTNYLYIKNHGPDTATVTVAFQR